MSTANCSMCNKTFSKQTLNRYDGKTCGRCFKKGSTESKINIWTQHFSDQKSGICYVCRQEVSILSFECNYVDNGMQIVCNTCVKKHVPKKESGSKRIPLPPHVRLAVWRQHVGDCISGTCYVCKRTLDIFSFECGHIVSVRDGGDNSISNLRVVCGPCNKSCGAMNMNEYKKFVPHDFKPTLEVHDTKMIVNNIEDEDATNLDEYELVSLSNYDPDEIKRTSNRCSFCCGNGNKCCIL
jgi:hypothetical protein